MFTKLYSFPTWWCEEEGASWYLEGFQPSEEHVVVGLAGRTDPGGHPGHGLGHGLDVGGCGATAAAHKVDQAVPGKLAHVLPRGVRLLIVPTKGVGQPGVRVAQHIGVRRLAWRRGYNI